MGVREIRLKKQTAIMAKLRPRCFIETAPELEWCHFRYLYHGCNEPLLTKKKNSAASGPHQYGNALLCYGSETIDSCRSHWGFSNKKLGTSRRWRRLGSQPRCPGILHFCHDVQDADDIVHLDVEEKLLRCPPVWLS